MTISTTSITKSGLGNGTAHSFVYDFPIFNDADLTVIVRSAAGTETTKTLNTHYVVTGAGASSGGTVLFKFNTGTSSDAHYSLTDQRPASGETVVIRSELSNTQTLDLVANDPFPASSFETALDRLVRMVQQHDEELDRSIKLSRTNTMTSTEFTNSATDRASKVLAFDSSGELSVTTELGTFRGNWAASTTYALRDIVKDTSTNNIFIATTAHTSSGSQPLTTNTDSAKWSLLVDAASATTSATAAASSATAAAGSATAAADSATATAADAVSTAADVVTTGNNVTQAATASVSATAAEAARDSAKAIAAAMGAALDSFDDRYLGTMADSATAPTSKTPTITTTNGSADITVSDATGLSIGMLVTSANIPAGTNVVGISGTTISLSNAATAAGSGTSSTFAGFGVYGAFNSSTDGPAKDNDNGTLVTGALYFNTSDNEMRVYDGANWIAASAAGSASMIIYEYTVSGSATATFTGSDDNGLTLSYTTDNIIVVKDGVTLHDDDYTSTNGTSIVLGSNAAVGSEIVIYAFKSFTVADTVPKSSGGNFLGNIQINGADVATTGKAIAMAIVFGG